jgi:hypothetical protein
MACEAQANKLTALQGSLESLQAELDDAPPAAKPNILKAIEKCESAIENAQFALDECEAQQGTGPVVAWSASTSAWLIKPVQGHGGADASTTLSFSNDLQTFSMKPFTVQQTIAGIDVVLEVAPASIGVVDPPGADGRRDMSITVSVNVNASGLPVVGSVSTSVDMTLSTSFAKDIPGDFDSPNGNGKMNGAGYLTMAAEGVGNVDGYDLDFVLTVEGVVTPMPWAVG